MTLEEGRHPLRSVAGASLLVLLSAAVHSSALQGWWLYDDPALIIEAIRQSLRGLFFDPAEYTHLAAHTFVPLQIVSYKIDLALAGLSPRAFYAHQVASLTLAGVLLFYMLRRWTGDLVAFLGAAMFLTSWAAVYAARTLMIRHYVEGMVLALAALLAWQKRRDPAGALFYFMALLAKEVWAPIPLLLAVLARADGDSWRTVARRLVAPAVSLGVYLFWRLWMIHLVGGYSATPTLADFLHLPSVLGDDFCGPVPMWARVSLLLLSVALTLLFLAREKWRGFGLILPMVVVAILPVLPLAASFEWRYAFAFGAVAISGLAIFASSSRRAGSILLGLLFLTTAACSFSARGYYERLTRLGIEREGRYVWTQAAQAPALAAMSPGWYCGSLSWLRRWSGHGEAPGVFYSMYAITSGGADGARAVTIDPANGALLPLANAPAATAAIFGTPERWRADETHRDDTLPLSARFTMTHHDAGWKFGPDAGTFLFLTDDGYTAIPVPAEGSRRVPAARERQYFRVRRDDPDGKWTVSPRLAVPYDGEVTSWRR